jgi:glycosyltransferase involved in cell wall biosynthesis
VKVLLANGEKTFRGGEFQTVSLASHLARAGCHVMIAARDGSPLAAAARASLPCATFPFERVPVVTPFRLSRLMARWRPDVVHAQTSDAHTHAWLARKLLSNPPPLVVSRRVAFPVRRNPPSLWKYRTGVAHFIPISRAAARSLADAGVPGGRMTIVPSGVDVSAFRAAGRRAGAARPWGAGAEDFVIGTVAAFEREKGHLVLVRAASGVLAAYPRTRFVWIGEGSLRNEILAEIQRFRLERSVILAAQEAPLEEVLPQFDIMALPSLEEGLSTALIAALAAGLPAVASETGGIPDVVTEDCGILVPPGDADALARAIIRLEGDAGLRERMRAAGRERAERFDISVVVRRTIDVYSRVLGGDGAIK